MNKIRKTLGIVGTTLALTVGGMTVAMPANAVTASVSWTKYCYGPDLWNIKVTTYSYSFIEIVKNPRLHSYSVRKPYSLAMHNSLLCVRSSKA